MTKRYLVLASVFLLAGCVSLSPRQCADPEQSDPEQGAPEVVRYDEPQRLTFIDSEVFDGALQRMLNEGVDVLAVDFVSDVRIDKIPERIEHWITGFATIGDGIAIKDIRDRPKGRGVVGDFVDQAMRLYRGYKDSRRFLATRGYAATIYYNRENAMLVAIDINRTPKKQ